MKFTCIVISLRNQDIAQAYKHTRKDQCQSKHQYINGLQLSFFHIFSLPEYHYTLFISERHHFPIKDLISLDFLDLMGQVVILKHFESSLV